MRPVSSILERVISPNLPAKCLTTGHYLSLATAEKLDFARRYSTNMAKNDSKLPKASYRQLGKSGLRVSNPILGAMSIGLVSCIHRLPRRNSDMKTC